MHRHFTARTVTPIVLIAGLAPAMSACSEKPRSKPAAKPAPTTATQSQPPQPSATRPSQDAAATNPAGHGLYINNCASCHGDSGRGDGPMAQFLATPPRGLVIEPWRTFPATSEQEERAGIESVVRQGFPDRGMPAYAKRLTDDEIKSIVDQVLSMRAAAKGG